MYSNPVEMWLIGILRGEGSEVGWVVSFRMR